MKLVTEAPWWEELKPGMEVTWMYQPRGGYGSVVPVDAKVLKVNEKTIRIEARKKTGEFVKRNVKPENLRRKAAS